MNDKLFIIGMTVLLASLVSGAVYAEVSMKKPTYYAGAAVQCPNCGNCQDLDYETDANYIHSQNRWQCPKCGCCFSNDPNFDQYI